MTEQMNKRKTRLGLADRIRQAIDKLVWLWHDVTPIRRLRAYPTLVLLLIVRKFRGRHPYQSTWLIGEAHGNCQPDNGYYFFKYCRTVHPDAAVFFVVRRSSPYNDSLQSDPNVLAYGSLRHVAAYARAGTCFYTHTVSDFIYRELARLGRRRRKLVFLHHGTLGFKRFDPRYHRNRNVMNLFTVGCDFERELLLEQEGVDAERVVVTGYARYDAMRRTASPGARQIVYMPTHRDWLRGSVNMLADTDFLNQIERLVAAPELHDLLQRAGFTLKIKLHPAYRALKTRLVADSAGIKILKSDAETPRELIRNSSVLVTDYSSVALDFLQLGKPVLFYRFDIERYRAGRGSYIDLDDPAFGDIFYDLDSLIAGLARVIDGGCKLDAARERTRQRLTRRADGRCCERIYERARSLTESR